jgi:hypothetical protein
VVWPFQFQELGWESPSLFYFDGNEPDALPKGYMSLHSASIGVPKKARKGYPCTIRVDGADHPDHDSSHDKYVLAAESDVQKEEWLAVLQAASEGKATKLKLVLFGASLDALLQEQSQHFPV